MKLRLFTAIAFTAMAVISCNEETASIGKSLTDEDDKLQVTTGVYEAFSRSLLADSVYGQNFECYFGQIKDPETETYVKSEFMTQFNLLEGTTFPSKELMLLGEDGNILVDSCEIRLFIDKTKCYGDSLTPLKMSIKELDKPMDENAKYYSNYDPEEKGLIRKDGMKKSMMFTVSNRTFSDSIRKLTGYQDFIRVRLNDPYTAKDGKKYSNFGSYILQNYYDHPEYFKNSYTFVHTLCPGLYFQITEGIGSMAYIEDIRLTAFYRYKKSDDKKARRESSFFWEERNRWFSDLWEIKGAKQKISNSESRDRNASFPLEVPFRLINMYSQQNDTVLDPFYGLGTTSIAAMLTGRNSVGVEIDEKLRPSIENNFGSIVIDNMNLLIHERYMNHLNFIRDREALKKTVKYYNTNLSCKVMTSQEVDMNLHYMDRIIKSDDQQLTYTCRYHDDIPVMELISKEKGSLFCI